jgi:bifunctional ADP-heptose synthase (sugar kinase/adenylyltransferase)
MSPSYRDRGPPRGPDPDGEDDPSVRAVDEFIEKLKDEGILARRALVNYNESNEGGNGRVIKWFAGVGAGVALAVIVGSWEMSTQFAALKQQVADKEVRDTERNAELQRRMDAISIQVERLGEQRNRS